MEFRIEPPSGDASVLLDYAKKATIPFTWEDAEADLGWGYQKFMRAVHDLRMILAETDTMNLVCEPAGHRLPWEYRLVGSLVGELWWQANRQADTLTRIRTELAVNKSIVAATTSRTVEGRRARVIAKGLGRLIEDLADLMAE